MEAAVAIRRRRHEAGLSLRALARRAHTSPATLLRYERGEIPPGTETLERILAATFSHRRRWTSLEALANNVAQALENNDEEWAWRLCSEVLDDEHAGTVQDALMFVSRRPELTGNTRADAVVAALAEYICATRGSAPPKWLWEPRICRPFWFIVGGMPSYAPLALRESPPSFVARGIFLTRADLSVA